MNDTRTTVNVQYIVQTDTSDNWCSGDSYDDAITEFHKAVKSWEGIFALNRKLGVDDSEMNDIKIPTEIRGIVRRTSTTTFETTEEQLPYPPEDQQ